MFAINPPLEYLADTILFEVIDDSMLGENFVGSVEIPVKIFLRDKTEKTKWFNLWYTDIFGKENSQRQFFSVPGRGGVPDQSAFAHWLYRTPDTCKEGNGLACMSGAGTTGVLSK